MTFLFIGLIVGLILGLLLGGFAAAWFAVSKELSRLKREQRN